MRILNLYAMVSDNPETFADLDGHLIQGGPYNLETGDISGGQDGDGHRCDYVGGDCSQQNVNGDENAGIAAERKYNPTSIKQDKEYAGWIEKGKNGKYVVDPAHPGTQAGSDPGPRPKNAAGEYHTHGGNDPGYDNEHFSNQDKWFLHNNHVPGFLGTPGHTIQEYDPATGKVIIFKERTD